MLLKYSCHWSLVSTYRPTGVDCGVGVGVSHLKETPDSGPYLSHLDFCVILLQCI